MKTESLCVSVDVAHAYSPNHPKKYDPKHQLIPGQGIAIKYNADKKYVTDAKTAAPSSKLAAKQNSLTNLLPPIQTFQAAARLDRSLPIRWESRQSISAARSSRCIRHVK